MPEVKDAFSALDSKEGAFLKTKRLEEDLNATMGPHLVRLPKGASTDYISLTPYQQFAWHSLGRAVKMKAREDPVLEENLLKAHMRIRPEEYTAVIWMNTIIAAIVGVVAGVVFGVILFNMLGLMLGIVIIALLPLMTYMLGKSKPGSTAKARGRNIDKKLYNAMSFISSMASANVNIDVIFKELSKQPIYGEIKNEAEWITRDTEILGLDILSAIKRGTDRTPSRNFQDFLQGVITTTTSGGQLKPYFLLKAEQYEKENKLALKGKMETLGMLAETFVTVGVAFPLFLVIIMAIMAIISKTSDFILNLLYVVVGGMIPGVQVAFIFVLAAVGGEEA